jgi:hypothetical protein
MLMIPNYRVSTGLLYHLSDDHQPNLVDPFRVSSHISAPDAPILCRMLIFD